MDYVDRSGCIRGPSFGTGGCLQKTASWWASQYTEYIVDTGRGHLALEAAAARVKHFRQGRLKTIANLSNDRLYLNAIPALTQQSSAAFITVVASKVTTSAVDKKNIG
jgi:hypothetical protein